MRERERDRGAKDSDEHLETGIETDEPCGPPRRSREAKSGAVGEHAKQVGARAQAEHEDGDDDRRRIHRVAVDLAELPDPHHLVDQAAHA